MMAFGRPWPFLKQDQICFLMLLYEEVIQNKTYLNLKKILTQRLIYSVN